MTARAGPGHQSFPIPVGTQNKALPYVQGLLTNFELIDFEQDQEMYKSNEFFMLQEDAARRIALIVGVTSAAKSALEELEKRRKEGQDAVIWRDGKKWIVGPRPVDE